MKQLFIAIALIFISFTSYSQEESTQETYPKLPH